MQQMLKPFAYIGVICGLLIWVGLEQSWSVSLGIINLCLISSIMALGVNIQWGYAGLFNVGTMGFVALGGLAGVIVSQAPVAEAWQQGGLPLLFALVIVAIGIALILLAHRQIKHKTSRQLITLLLVVATLIASRYFYLPAVDAIEAIDPAKTGYLGGLGLPILFSWPIGALLAAAAAWIIGKITLGLRSDYLAIATLGISEIIIAVIKNEDWLARGVKNVSGLDRPVPYEIDLQQSAEFTAWVQQYGWDPAIASGITVKLCYAALFSAVLIILFVLLEKAIKSPWGRMMRAIRDNEDAASAMGKDVTKKHLLAFVMGSAVIGLAGAMLTTLDGQFTPGSYQPLRFTFLVWVMVIVGGSGNNLGSLLGGFIIWFFWIEAEPLGVWLIDNITLILGEQNSLRLHLMTNASHMRMMFMGLILLIVLRYSPKGLLPEKQSTY